MKVEIYSDIACPWCYIGERRFARALADFPGADDVEIVFRSYQLDPDAPSEAVPHSEYMEKRFGHRGEGMHRQVDAAGAEEGIRFAWDKALAVNTRTAHRLLRLAEQEYGSEVQRALVERLFDLHFTRGGDLADSDQLVAEAVAVGIDGERARDYLDSGEGRQELEQALQAARDLGVRAVPTFVFDGKAAVEGAQPPARFLEALEEVARTAARTAAGTANECADGVCAV